MPLSFKQAKHLLLRTGFGGTHSQIVSYTRLSRLQAVNNVLDSVTTHTTTTLPQWINQTPPTRKQRKSLSQEERRAFRKQIRQRALELQQWWFREMISSQSPFNERMVLFWHNHFTSSFKKVRWPGFLWQQHFLHRQFALGNFADYLHHIAKDPAMMIYLDSVSNNKNRPNENFARELLELFTLGPGHYSEVDIREAARAFTGWKINRRKGRFRFAKRQHDRGLKTFLGQTGYFDGDDIINILIQHPRLAVHLTEKLWREFISPEPDKKSVAQIAKAFRESNYNLRVLMSMLFSSEHFWDPSNHGVLIKSPVELMIGTVRYLSMDIENLRPLQRICRRLGQDLFNPPNVKGWAGGNHWISAGTLLMRKSSLNQMMRNAELGHKHMDEKNNMRGTKPMKNNAMQMDLHLPTDYISHLTSGDFSIQTLEKVLLALPNMEPVKHKILNGNTEEALDSLTQLLLNPIYQLK